MQESATAFSWSPNNKGYPIVSADICFTPESFDALVCEAGVFIKTFYLRLFYLKLFVLNLFIYGSLFKVIEPRQRDMLVCETAEIRRSN